MQTMADYEKAHEGESFLIIGAGGTLREYRDKVVALSKSTVTIGINNMSSIVVPDYHLWTNTKRFKKFGRCISLKSIAMFGNRIDPKLIKKNLGRPYVTISYVDRRKSAIGYREGRIEGFFRTAGNLAIMVAHLMGAKMIYIAGMDGYTFYTRRAVNRGGKHQHVYGSRFTDGSNWKVEADKDRLVYISLKRLKSYGIKFSIITPTHFLSFYDGSVI